MAATLERAPSGKSMPMGDASHATSDARRPEYIEDRSARRSHGLPSRFTKGRFLGKGGFAKCYEVHDIETGVCFAAKIVAKASITKPRAQAKLRSEIAIHRQLDHDKIVKFHDAFEDNENVYMILELCPNLTLNEFMKKRQCKRLSEPEAMFFLYDLLLALKHLHRRRVIHRDLKLGNLFLDADARLKVGDFGLAAQLEHDGERKRTICGTPNYIAPEILEGGRNGHSYEVDTWSFGVIMYTMLFGRPPFETSDVKTTYRRIRCNQYSFPDSVHASPAAKDLIGAILRTDPRARPSLDEVLGAPWFSCQRLPPAVPASVNAMASPRFTCSARSETPERGVPDFARIDSPSPALPLRDRSPSSVPTPQNQGGRSTCNALRAKQQDYVPTTPIRGPSGGLPYGRPPLAQKGAESNDENVAPSGVYSNVDKGALSPTVKQASLPLGAQCQGSPNRTPCGSTTRLGVQHMACPGPPTVVQSPVASRGSSFGRLPSKDRDSSPYVHGGGQPVVAQNQSSARVVGQGTSRPSSATPQAAIVSGRTPGTKDARITRVTCSPLAVEGGSFARTTSLGALRGGTSPPPCTGRQLLESTRAQYSGVRNNFLTPRADADSASARTPRAISERRALSTRQLASPAMPRRAGDGTSGPQASEPTTPIAACLAPPAPLTSGEGSASAGKVPEWADALDNEQAWGGAFAAQANTAASQGIPHVWVTKWVDYSSKYGIGYTLSDGSLGVYFNDSTKIILSGNRFDYITRRTQDRPEQRSTHTFEDFPEDLKKKVTLLRHFKNYMTAETLDSKGGASLQESSLRPPYNAQPQVHEPGQAPYIKKWTKNKHATLFQLSHRVVQVVFFDKTEALLSSTTHTVTYVDKRGQVSEYPLSSHLDVPNHELAKRLKYTKDILVNLLGVRTSDLTPAR